MAGFWSEWSGGRRVTFVLAALIVVGAGVALYMMLTSHNYQVLYKDLDTEQAAKLTEKLNELKIPYQLGAQGSQVLVSQDDLYNAKLKLASSGYALNGGVGFELFDEADYGMTEFAQKINYQRALQGELARTIMAFDEIKFARVHLVLPESSLFKKDNKQPKASVTIVMEDGKYLSLDQINGIQNLVAASVEGLKPETVTLLNHKGVALTQVETGDQATVSAQLKGKSSMEAFLQQKIVVILNQIFDEGTTAVRVDVALNHKRVERVRETLVPFGDTDKGAVIKSSANRQYELPDQDGRKKPSSVISSDVKEEEYAYGKQVETLSDAGGEVERITVSVVIPANASGEQIEVIKSLIASAIGLDFERGDLVNVAAMGIGSLAPATLNEVVEAEPVKTAVPMAAQAPWENMKYLQLAVVLLVVVAMLLLILLMASSGRRKPKLTAAEREETLAEIKTWLNSVDRA
ncbi:flagellar M-ring protein FliF [Hahella chejuensis KCTC 2396]|uniref:Flagellar M-ring protein n=1 Tax=Hahella chejuensis (strain KCTC 2396) TaxID=349521 RepID=Q2SEY3_HAHCH|nr:flagellar basal-body MS-ring/collar protein FliF [Hahella chejuensis]ABC30791.1 flagellar M-ring protein FliF [Hahella chejuensis KCTC 2396]